MTSNVSFKTAVLVVFCAALPVWGFIGSLVVIVLLDQGGRGGLVLHGIRPSVYTSEKGRVRKGGKWVGPTVVVPVYPG